MPYVDLAFRLNESVIFVDHGYALYGALSRIFPEIHEDRDIKVQPIRGIYNGKGELRLSAFSRLVIRLPDSDVKSYLGLTGEVLDVDGHIIRVGVPEVRKLLPVPRLRSRLVTIKGFLEEEEFLEALKRQLEDLNIAGEVLLGKRRTFRVKQKQVVGFEVAVMKLTAEESLKLQERGVGGRQKMGCGVFVPWRS